jgi:hypothetical protein
MKNITEQSIDTNVSQQYWTLINYMCTSPYDKVEGRRLTEEEFYKDPKYFVNIPSWMEYKKELDSFFENVGYLTIRHVLLSGFRGIGKTTFIHWYIANSDVLSKYTTLILNMDDAIPSYTSKNIPKFGHTIFQTYLRDILIKFLFDNFLKFREFLFQYLYPKNGMLKQCFSDGKLDIESSFEFVNVFDGIEELTEKILNEDGRSFSATVGENKQKGLIRDYLCGLNYIDLFLLFLLLYEYDNESKMFFHRELGHRELSERPFLILVFDNIDHIAIESSNADFPSILGDVYRNFRKAVGILRGEAQKVLSIHFIFSIRDTNRNLLNLQCDGSQPKEIEFIPVDIDKIIERRIEIAKDRCSNIRTEHVTFLQTFFNDHVGRKLFLTLFNFNIRTLADNLDELQQNSMYVTKIKELYDNRDAHSGYANGARGIYYFLLIRRLLRNDFLKEGMFIDRGDEIIAGSGHVNPTRIILTNLCSMSKYMMDTHTLKIQNNNPQGLYDLYKTYSSLFKGEKYVDQFFDILAKLFLFHKHNWSHLISFTNKQVFSKNVFDKEKKQLGKYVAKNQEIPSSLIAELNTIKIQLNPAGYMYLEKVIVHYEFYSARAGNERPLFYSLKVKKSNNGGQSFEFLENIDKTWEQVKTCIDSLLEFMKSDLCKDFETTDHCYARHIGNDCVERKLMIVRIIHTHLRYLDNFREYLLVSGLYKQFDTPEKSINEELIMRQQRYIDKLERLCNVRDISRNRKLLNAFQKNMKLINAGNNVTYIPLLNEREYEKDYSEYEKDI